MAHYAFLHNNIVTEVITGIDETELIEGLSPEEWYGNFRGQSCIRTSYNGKIRGKYAAIGDLYDEQTDTFIPPTYIKEQNEESISTSRRGILSRLVGNQF
jgi:hypothetical protein